MVPTKHKQGPIVPPAKDALDRSQHPCHNCRRQRLKCDRSIPQCAKCIKRGHECLGYSRLFRWREGVANRGLLTGVTFANETADNRPALARPLQRKNELELSQTSLRSLTDPLVQDLSHTSRLYLSYFASDVCRNLVLYDTPHQNPFRELIPLTRQDPILLQIIIANSALHMFNASQKFSGRENNRLHESRRHEVAGPYFDALTAKQRTLSMLRQVLTHTTLTYNDVVLAVMVLLIEFELMESGSDDWRHHVKGAEKLIAELCQPQMQAHLTLSPIRSCLISNWMVFEALRSMLASSENTPTLEASLDNIIPHVPSLLRDAEGNHCSSFPAVLLQLVQAGTRLSQPSCPISLQIKQNRLFPLVCAARSFDPLTWATELQPRSPSADLQQRNLVARGHKAAVTIYLSRLLLSLYPTTKPSCDFVALVDEVMGSISQIRKHDALFTATIWPAFIAGAETDMAEKQELVVVRLRELWEVEPWGLMRGALRTLETIWSIKKRGAQDGKSYLPGQRLRDGDWIQYLRETGVNWLIL
ncbi:hypothetical protein D6D01_05518 [Aureobasidium pullulans]|uniref:Zn(2)-C6 fungal-type domain-containing protein n=1 Tax=Aureobasidium pullulans TaxID=5580 RepID=A0A4V4JV68_AURPU|nr:hypothetical protein D6D01_05518 [Aureobasidium pullulans]